MNDANGHALAVGDIVKPDNDPTTTLKINASDGTTCQCRFPTAVGGPAFKYLAVHLIWQSTPTS